MKLSLKIFAGGLVVALGLGIFGACNKKAGDHQHSTNASSEMKGKFHCPMHPTYVSDKPGDCPICAMSLVPIESEEAHEKAVRETGGSKGERKILFYRHPMQPGVTSPVPKKDEMGMDYVPVYSDEEQAATAVSGRSNVKLSADREQLIGVRTEKVTRKNLSFLVRASARVAYDPDLYSAMSEYKEALIARDKMKDSPWPEAHERAEALLEASTLRLRQLGLSQNQINEISSTSKNPTNLLIGQSGGTIWVYAQIYEYESGLIREGQSVEVIASAFPGRQFWGKVKAVDPILNSETRSLRARVEVPNPEGLLKPEMYADAVIHVDLGSRLAIPAGALIDTGTRQLVYVMKGEGQYEPREVRIGHEAEGAYEVLSGVKEGEEVVASANFLIDSESKLKAAISQAGSGGHQH